MLFPHPGPLPEGEGNCEIPREVLRVAQDKLGMTARRTGRFFSCARSFRMVYNLCRYVCVRYSFDLNCSCSEWAA